MKSFVLYFLTGLLNLFVLLSFGAVAAGISLLPLLAMLGAALLLFLAPLLHLYRPKWGAAVGFPAALMVSPWLVGYGAEIIADIFINGWNIKGNLIPLAVSFVLLALVGFSALGAYRLLFARKDIGWNSNNSQVHRILKAALTLLIVFIFSAALWRNQTQPSYFNRPPPKPTPVPLADRGNRENLVIAVAPMAVFKLPPSAGVSIQNSIADHMQKDLGLKVIKLSSPVSMQPSPSVFDIDLGSANAETLIAQTGADLLIWGNEDIQGDGKDWSVYVSASVKAQCLAREQGFSIHSTSDLDEVSSADLLEVLDWVTMSWRGLLDHSQGMYIAQTMQPMVDKIDTVLGLVAEKQMGPQALQSVKTNLVFFLASYGLQTNDVKALTNAIRLAREGAANAPVDPETKRPRGDMEMESILAKCLFSLGTMQNDPQNLVEALGIYRDALKGVNPQYDPADWAVLQCDLGADLAELGQRRADQDMIRQAVQAFAGAETKTDKQTQPNQWLCVQNGLGSSYLFLGARETDTADLKKAIPHYQEALSNNAELYQPNDFTMVEMNLGVLYLTLGEREKSPDDMRQSALYCGKAADRFEKMGNSYAEGFSLCNLGQAQTRLAGYTDDEALLAQSQETLKKSQSMVPQAQDATLWSKSQLYLALGEEAQGAKTFDLPAFQDALDKINGLKALYDPKTRRPMYNEMCNFQAELEILMGNLDCDSLRMNRILALLKTNKAAAGFQRKGFPLEQVDEVLGKAANLKGMKEKSIPTLRRSIAYFEEALATANQGNLNEVTCSIETELASAYANLLLLTPDGEIASRAKALVAAIETNCLAPPIPVNQAQHHLCAAKLERALAFLDKDSARLVRGRALAEAGLKILNDHHYVFWAAMGQEELGDEDLLLAQLTGDPAARKKAAQEYGEADQALLAKGVCWEKELKAKLLKAKNSSKEGK